MVILFLSAMTTFAKVVGPIKNCKSIRLGGNIYRQKVLVD